MKVLLIKDVYKLGRAGDVKRVADGYGRNFLIPQGLAVLATAGALKQSEKIRAEATARRAILNEEMGSVAEQLAKVQLAFASKAGETGKLYGSITTQDVADAIQQKTGISIKRQQIDMQPLRVLGEHTIRIRLTVDLIPEIKALVYREGEAEPGAAESAEAKAAHTKAKKQAETAEAASVEAEPEKIEPVEIGIVETEPVLTKSVETEPVPTEPAETEAPEA